MQRIRLIPPEGFLEAEKFPGYEQPSTGSTLVVREIPAPSDGVIAGFDDKHLARHDMMLVGREDLSGNGEPRCVMHVVQKVGDEAFEKWIAILGDEKETVIVTGTCRQGTPESVSGPLRASIYSVEWEPVASHPTGLQMLRPQVGGLQLARKTGTGEIWTLKEKRGHSTFS